MKHGKQVHRTAFAFILLMGIISLFSDMTHEGAKSILGAWLPLIGATPAVIGFVSGLGEFLGYSLRLVTGVITDKTKNYWGLTIAGYILDLAVIPLLALIPENGWIAACGLLLTERVGKAVKKPAKDTILSFAATKYGVGKGFAIQELLDQIGAFAGPVILFMVLWFRNDPDPLTGYAVCFAVLGIPAVLTVLLLFFARHQYPHPERFEESEAERKEFRFRREFVMYILAISCFAVGFIDFPMVTMHAARLELVAKDVLPLLYAGAMLLDAVSALVFGYLYDRIGILTLMISTAVSAAFPILIFGADSKEALFAGVILWGIGMGAQESILKAAVCSFVPKHMRSTGFGIFQTAFGAFWFLGSWLTGVLYEVSIGWMIAFSMGMQFLSVPLFGICWRMVKEVRQRRRSESAAEDNQK